MNINPSIKCHNYITVSKRHWLMRNRNHTCWCKFESPPSDSCLWVLYFYLFILERKKKVPHLQSVTELRQVRLFQRHWSAWEGFALGKIILTLSTPLPPSLPSIFYHSSFNFAALMCVKQRFLVDFSRIYQGFFTFVLRWIP